MQKPYILFFLIVLFIPCHSFSQDTITQATVSHKKISSTNHINPGFYIKLGPTFPIRTYSKGIKLKTSSDKDTSYYLPASMGGAMDLGFLIYIGPSFANHHIRLGIDATFLSIWFNSIKSDTITGPKTQYWYYFLGQKFGPVISVCPVDRLVIDFSYKLNAYVAYLHHKIRGQVTDEWGKNLTQNELSMNIRYSLMLFSFQYNFGKVAYNDFDSSKPVHNIDNSTFRVMIGFKF
jgi:hypothetical protein